jgi:hypothetical protein
VLFFSQNNDILLIKIINLETSHKFDFNHNQVNIYKYINNLKVDKMSKLLKITTMLMITSFSQLTFAAYQVAVPLEMDAGGGLPNGSVSFGKGDNTENEGEAPSTNCIYDNQNYVVLYGVADGPYQIGDMIFIAGESVISYYSPSNNKFIKPGLSKGKQMQSYPQGSVFEICANDLSIYPIMGDVDEDDRPPIDDHTGPDWTPECILNTSTDYAARNTIDGTREFHSTTFGLNHFKPTTWYYVPADYDPESSPVTTSSYIYFDNFREDDERISGPNPNFGYSEICRVKKMEL